MIYLQGVKANKLSLYLELLQNFPSLHGARQNVMKLLSSRMILKRFASNSVIVKEGDISPYIIFLVKGSIKV